MGKKFFCNKLRKHRIYGTKQSIIGLIIACCLLVMAIGLSSLTVSENLTIKGKVTDTSNGSGLSGVNILAEGTNISCETDINGEYHISVNDSIKKLVFSFSGYKTETVKIKGKSMINVKMEEELAADKMEETGIRSSMCMKSMAYSSAGSSGQSQGSGNAMMYSSPVIADYNTEGYSAIQENGFKKVNESPVSTFSIDVDNASYSNVRRYINSGNMPPVDAVRVEEMINYFDYHYPQPKDENPFSTYYEISDCPWNKDSKLLHIGLQGKNIETDKLPPSSLVFLLDVSGSMSDQNKLPLVKQAFRMLVNQLRPQDIIAIVTYSDIITIALPSANGNERDRILDVIDKLYADGSTAGGAALQSAYEMAEKNFIKDGNNRIILATDGDFNVGVSSNADMERLVEKEKDKGIFISVIGFGMGNYKDDKLEIISDKGNGNYAYIDNIQEAQKEFISEFGGTLFTIAKDVKLQIEFNPAKIESYRLVGYENRLLNREDFENDKKDAGEMGAGHEVTALYEIIMKTSDDKEINSNLKYQDSKLTQEAINSNEIGYLKIRYKQPDGVTSKLLDVAIIDNKIPIDKTTDDFRFSAAVAEFGMLLRESEFKGNATYDNIVALAKDSKGQDDEGYRAEFIRLVQTFEALK